MELVKKFSVVVVGGGWWVVVLKATLVFIFGLNLKTRFQPSSMSGIGQKLFVVWWWYGACKPIIRFIFGPNHKTRTLLQPRPKLNNLHETHNPAPHGTV